MKILMKLKTIKGKKIKSMKFLGSDITRKEFHEIEINKEDKHLLKSKGVLHWFEIKKKSE